MPDIVLPVDQPVVSTIWGLKGQAVLLRTHAAAGTLTWKLDIAIDAGHQASEIFVSCQIAIDPEPEIQMLLFSKLGSTKKKV